jgi:glycosyltransferase involved in cell wall biosynthesis
VNTVPFFTPLWADIPRFLFIHQLAREVWWYESPFPINVLGYLCEPLYLRLYRSMPVLTVSRSTEKDLLGLGFSGPIAVVPEGLEAISMPDVSKESIPTFLYVGRLSPSKRVGHVVRAFSLFRRGSEGKLWIVGDGSAAHSRRLIKRVRQLGLADDVAFLGRVSNEDKHNLMARAHALVLASAREGWGLVVTEANACGTLAIAYDVPGLRDSIRDQETGFLVDPTPKALSEAMVFIWAHPILCNEISDRARRWSQSFSYDTTVEAVIKGMRLSSRAESVVTEGDPQAANGLKSL